MVASIKLPPIILNVSQNNKNFGRTAQDYYALHSLSAVAKPTEIV